MSKTIKQKNQVWTKYEPSLESFLDKIIYNPWTSNLREKNYKNGNLYRKIGGMRKILESMTKEKFSDFNFYFIAQSHLDAAWLFPVLDAKIRAYKTFYQAIKHIEQFPDFFTFSQTSPQYYSWIKHYSPELWKQVKKYVKIGKIEPVGGMWVEPTLDEVSGEALVRQRLFGQLWFQREFGKMPKVESLLDVFGFPHSLPQILVKSGATAFWTTKCSWNDTNKWPLANYMWRGCDGSQIFTHHFKLGDAAIIGLKDYKKMGRLPKPEYKQAILSSGLSNAKIE